MNIGAWFKRKPPAPKPKQQYDVEWATVKVWYLDNSDEVRDFTWECKGRQISWWDHTIMEKASALAQEFVEGKRPFNLGNNHYIPRHRVIRYDREGGPFIIEGAE